MEGGEPHSKDGSHKPQQPPQTVRKPWVGSLVPKQGKELRGASVGNMGQGGVFLPTPGLGQQGLDAAWDWGLDVTWG